MHYPRNRVMGYTQPMTATARRFDGFTDTRRTFFQQLRRRQDRTWFAEHKQEFQALWSQPMLALLHEAYDALRSTYRLHPLDPPRLFRMYRDVRFSRDKSPLKMQLAGAIDCGNVSTEGRMEKPVALYFHVGEDITAAAGRYVLAGRALAQFREEVLDPKKGPAWERLVRSLTSKGYTLGAFDQLKTAPRGVDPDHPRIHLLRLKGLVVGFPPISPSALGHRTLLTDLVRHAKRAAPLGAATCQPCNAIASDGCLHRLSSNVSALPTLAVFGSHGKAILVVN